MYSRKKPSSWFLSSNSYTCFKTKYNGESSSKKINESERFWKFGLGLGAACAEVYKVNQLLEHTLIFYESIVATFNLVHQEKKKYFLRWSLLKY